MQCWKVDIGRSCKGISDQRTGIRYNRLAQRRNGEKEASMNKVILVGRLTRDPEVRYADKEKKRVFTRYTLAVERKIKKEQEPTADFISCVAFQHQAEFAANYFRQGMRIAVSGRIQTGSYVNREGIRIYTTDVIIEEQEFAESRQEQEQSRQTAAPTEAESEEAAFHG